MTYGRQHSCNEGADCVEFDQDPFILAVIDFEVARDDYNADQFRQTRMRKGSRPAAWAPTITKMMLAELQTTAMVMAQEAQIAFELDGDPDATGAALAPVVMLA